MLALLEGAGRSQPGGRRDFAVLLLAASLGLRASEIASLTLEDVDWRRQLLRVPRAKGGTEPTLPLSAERPSLRSKAIHPVHGWRYTTASHLLLAGVDAAVIQQWLGHTSITATSHYAQVPVEVKRQALEKSCLFERSWQQPGGGQVDWERHPSLLAFLESL